MPERSALWTGKRPTTSSGFRIHPVRSSPEQLDLSSHACPHKPPNPKSAEVGIAPVSEGNIGRALSELI